MTAYAHLQFLMMTVQFLDHTYLKSQKKTIHSKPYVYIP